MEVSSSKEITNEDLVLFKDALTGEGCDSIEVKLYTIKRVQSLAKALGPERTREELLDVISRQLDNLDDEVLFCLAEELEVFLPLVGGPEFSYELLSMLLKISRSVDETVVRNRAVEAIKKLLSDIDQQLTERFLVSNLVEVDDNTWFAEKCSTLSLIPVCYPKASPENKIILRQKYCQIFDDNSSLIRKLAAAGLPDFISVLDIEHVLKDCIPMLNQIVADDQDSVRINALEVCLSIANKSKNQEVRSDMLQIIKSLSKNESWRIRQRAALLIEKISQAFPDEEYVPILLEIYENLVNDDETEVRIYAVQNIYNFNKNLYENFKKMLNPKQKFEDIFMEKCMPTIISIISDGSDDVQIALSSTILSFSTILSNDCFKDSILPIVVTGLEKDKPLLFKENLLMNLDFLPNDVDLIKSLKSISKIVQHILVTSETSWRTRRSLLVTFVHVSKFCTEEFFRKNLLVYYIILLKDNIYAVRRTGTLILPILAKRFGAKWLVNDIMPHVHVTLKDEKYLIRYIILFCIQELLYPSADANIKEDGKYLGDLKKLLESGESKFERTLCKISRLNTKLRESLAEKPFDNILNTYVDNNNISGENVRIYSEDLLDTIMKNNINIFSVEQNKQDEEMCYLEGVLILLNKEILNVLKTLIKDPINNIQDRAKYVITKIKKFSDELNTELLEEWVTKLTSTTKDTVWEEIDAQILEQLDVIQTHFDGAETIDTDLMESIPSEPTSRHSIEVVEKLDIFPSDRLLHEEMHVDEMESVDEEKIKDIKS